MSASFDIKKILIPIDFSETSMLALEHAVFMAERYEAEIVFLHVFESFSYQMEISQMLIDSVKVGDLVKGKLDELAKETHRKSGVSISTEVVTGSVAANIVEVADELKVDIIVMGTHGSSGFEEFLIGSNAYKVVSKSPKPVLTIQDGATKVGYKNIVVPLDVSKASRQKMQYLVPFAKKYTSRFHLLVIDTDNDGSKMDVVAKQVEGYLKSEDVPYTLRKVSGSNRAKLVIDYATEINAELISIMTEQDPDISGLVLGPYAQQVVNHSKIPVLSFTPEEAKNVIFNPY